MKAGLCWDIILELTRYLSLNEIVNVFSINVLRALCKHRRNLHLCVPSNTFIKMVLEKLRPEQIVSLRLNAAVEFRPQIELSLLSNFSNIISLTLHNCADIEQMNECTIYLPNLTNLSLRYDFEVSFNLLTSIIYQRCAHIRRLKIRCAAPSCGLYGIDKANAEYEKNNTINSFEFDMSNAHSIFYLTVMMINLMQIMEGIQYLCVIVSKNDLKELLKEYSWKNLQKCHQLKKVTLKVSGSILPDTKVVLNALTKIEKYTADQGKMIKFQLKSL